MRSATSVIEDKLNTLAEQFRHHEKIVSEHTQAMRIVEAQMRVLKSVASEVGKPVREAERVEKPAGASGVNGKVPDGMKPADAVKALLRSHPDGMPQKEVVEILAEKIDSDSADKKRLLYNTIFNLRKRNVVRNVDTPNGESRIALVDLN